MEDDGWEKLMMAVVISFTESGSIRESVTRRRGAPKQILTKEELSDRSTSVKLSDIGREHRVRGSKRLKWRSITTNSVRNKTNYKIQWGVDRGEGGAEDHYACS